MDANGKNFGGMFVVAAWDVRMICSLHILRKSVGKLVQLVLLGCSCQIMLKHVLFD